MANSGFRGSSINIAEFSVKGTGTGSVVKFRVLFADPESHMVHAQTTHEVEIGEESPLYEPAKAMLAGLKAMAEGIHFQNTEATPTVEKMRGIVEAASDSSEDPGRSG